MKSDALTTKSPDVVLLYECEEDVAGAVTIIQDQVEHFRSLEVDDDTATQLRQLRPAVLIFALGSVAKNIEYYASLVDEHSIAFAHYSIVMCKNKESGAAFRSAIKSLFDDYFVYQPLYEKFRLKMIIHNALLHQQLTTSYTGIGDDQFDSIDNELAQLIEDSVARKKSLLGKISACGDDLKQAATTLAAAPDAPPQSQAELLQILTEQHVTPLLASLEAEIRSNLDDIVQRLLNQRAALQGTAGEASGAQPHPDEKPVQPAPAKRILIVEDNTVYRDVLVKMLQKEGYEVDEARDGVQAVTAIKTVQYDAIMMDLFMPNLDGVSATQQIKKISGGKKTPIIALTGNRKKEVICKWASLGLDAYLVKPSNKKDILQAVQKVTCDVEPAT